MVFDTETRESINSAAEAFCGALRYVGDVSYAALPRDVAHSLADLKKSLLNVVRTAVDKEIEWIDARVAGGDRLREEWRQYRRSRETETATEPVN